MDDTVPRISASDIINRLQNSRLEYDGGKFRAYGADGWFFTVGECRPGCGCAGDALDRGVSDIDWKKISSQCYHGAFLSRDHTARILVMQLSDDGAPTFQCVNT